MRRMYGMFRLLKRGLAAGWTASYLHRQWRNYEENADYEKGYDLFVLAMLAQWLGMHSALA